MIEGSLAGGCQPAPLPLAAPSQAAAPSAALAEEERLQTPREELANSLSHGLGVLGALAALPMLIGHASRTGRSTVGVGVFAVTALVLYSSSTLYHALPRGRTKGIVRFIEHNAIFLLIAGTYTPLTLGFMRGAWGWTPFLLIWGLAALGVSRKAVEGVRWSRFTTALCLVMGWAFLLSARQMPDPVFRWLVLGGLSYMTGLGFYVYERLRYSHCIWHLFVLAGTTMHFLAVWWSAG
jgi:hemolysin III